MTTRRKIHKSFTRLTGYELRRVKSVTSVEGNRPTVANMASPARPSAPDGAMQPAAVGNSASGQPRQGGADKLPNDYDEEMAAVIRAVRPYTMTSHLKLHTLISATRYIVRHEIPGDVVECGVWRGGSMHAVARTLDSLDDHSRDLYLYDTFDGMTQPTDKDVRFDGRSASSQLATQDKQVSAVWAYASLEDVRAGFEDVPYPRERLHFVAGPVEETIPGVVPERISILRLDTDWYESTAHELKHLYNRLSPGGVLILDDYGWWRGSKTATDEFLERTGERLLLVRVDSGRVAIKP